MSQCPSHQCTAHCSGLPPATVFSASMRGALGLLSMCLVIAQSHITDFLGSLRTRWRFLTGCRCVDGFRLNLSQAVNHSAHNAQAEARMLHKVHADWPESHQWCDKIPAADQRADDVGGIDSFAIWCLGTRTRMNKTEEVKSSLSRFQP